MGEESAEDLWRLAVAHALMNDQKRRDEWSDQREVMRRAALVGEAGVPSNFPVDTAPE